MMQDLLNYFESAGATDGPEAWTLALGEGADRLEVNLDHFRKWIERGMTTLTQRRQVPILNYTALWALREHFYLLEEGERDSRGQVWHSQPKPSVISDPPVRQRAVADSIESQFTELAATNSAPEHNHPGNRRDSVAADLEEALRTV